MSRFSAPNGLVVIFRLSDSVLGLATPKIAMEIIPSFVSIKALDQLLSSLGRLAKEVSLSRIFTDSQKRRASLMASLTHYETIIMASIHVFREFIVFADGI